MTNVRGGQHRPDAVTPIPESGVTTVRRSVPPALGENGPQAGRRRVSFEARPSEPLIGNIDVDAVIASIPEFYTVKGMFFGALSAQLGARFAESAAKLSARPRAGVYLPFTSYPARDFFRLFDATARRCYPNRGTREAYRRVARLQVAAFAQSALGRVAMNFANEPSAALVRYASSFSALFKGPSAVAFQTRPNEVTIDVTRYHGMVEYLLGIFEALVMKFGVTPTIAVDVYAPGSVAFRIRW